VAKTINNSISPKTGFTPSEMVLGKDGAGAAFLDFESNPRPHPFVKSEKGHIETITRQIKEMSDLATEKLLQIRTLRNEKINKTRIEKTFIPGQYVFVVDNTQVQGSSRPLKTRLSPSPYVVIRPLWTTTIVKRLSDGFTTTYSNDMLKAYDKTSPLFASLPKEISTVLLHDFKDLMDHDLTIICRNDPLEIPNGLQNFDADSEHDDVPHDDDDDDLNDRDDSTPGSGTVSVGNDNSDDPRPSTSTAAPESDSDSDSEEAENFMTLRNKKRVHFKD
jgi:hypothetical protein